MRIIAAILIVLSLCSCGVAASAEEVIHIASEESSSAAELSSVAEAPEEPSEPAEPEVLTFEAPVGLEPKRVLELYLEQLYKSYVKMLPVDLSPAVDFEHNRAMKNIENWNSLLAMRRRLIFEHGFCFVETARKAYSIKYIEERDLSDQRMAYIDLKDYGEGAVALHFIISGTKGEAYPPLLAVNSEHSVVLSFDGERYKVAYHYFPGSEGKFENDLDVKLVSKEQMLAELYADFADVKTEAPEPIHKRLYDGEAAAEYALTYCESRNEEFHFVGDWYGNCMNFASQCIWAGFREEGDTPKNFEGMTNKWYCGKKGGTMIWASVSRFWNWTQSKSCAMQTMPFYHAANAVTGDLVNVSSKVSSEGKKFTHALFVADGEKLLLAQNSPACFVYYSDLVNCDFRFLRPVSINS